MKVIGEILSSPKISAF